MSLDIVALGRVRMSVFCVTPSPVAVSPCRVSKGNRQPESRPRIPSAINFRAAGVTG